MRFSNTITSGVVASGFGLVAAQQRFTYADNQQPVEKDPEHIAANFPDVDIDLLSPAFLDPKSVPEGFTNNTSGPTSQHSLEYFLQTLAARNDWMTYHNPDFSSEEGRSLPYVVLSTSNAPIPPPMNSAAANETQKLRLWMQGGVHGNEPAGDQALLAFLGKMDNDTEWAASVLEKLEILVLPRYNPDGVAYFQRQLATSLDPNRDHTKLASRQTRDIKELNRKFNAHLHLDCHEYGASRRLSYNESLYAPLQDNQFSHYKNPNVHRSIRELGESLFVPEVQAALEDANMTTSPYVVAMETPEGGLDLQEFVTDTRGDVAIFLGQGLSFLSETRGIRLGDQHFKRRTAAGLTAIVAVVQTAADNAELAYETVEDARADFISGDEDIIISEYPRWSNRTWPFIDAETGDVVEVPVRFGNNTPPESNLTRSRPEAYVFSRAWLAAAEGLRVAGLEVIELPVDFVGEVEALNITSASVEAVKYEGTARTTVTTEARSKTMRFPAGAFWVSTRQQNAAQAFVRLEPEHQDSFVTFNILPVSVGDEYPVYRVLGNSTDDDSS